MVRYDAPFFDVIRAGCQASAAVVAPLVLQHVPARSVIDVGCGEGHWGAEFQRLGCVVLGVDGDYVDSPVIPFAARDLTKPLHELEGYDLAVCLEVAEHLPESAAANLIAGLCDLAPVVLFSAAIPGQGGTGHVNEQWPGYWTDLFGARGYACSGALRFAIWDDDRVENWYRQNLIIAAAHPRQLPGLFDTPLAPVWPLVHPVLYDARRR